MKGFFKKNKYCLILIVISIVLIGYIYLDNTKNAHDLDFHIANINNIISNNLKTCKIMPNIGNNLGYGLYIFYPMLTHFTYALISSIFSIINISLINSILIINILVSAVSSICMYAIALKITKSDKKAFISALVYLLFPYRLGTITVRMALAENFASIFLPIILLGLYYLFEDNKPKFIIFFVIGYSGLIFSHYLISMYFSVFVFIILISYIDKLLKNKRIWTLLLGVLAVTIIVMPNIVVFAEHYGMDYLVYKENYVTNFALIKANLLEFSDYIIPSNDYSWTIPYYVYFTVICFSIFSASLIIKEHKCRKEWLCLILIVICLIFMSSKVLWLLLPKFCYNIQFPWRLLLIFSVFISLLVPKFLDKLNGKTVFIITAILCILPALFLVDKLSNRIYHANFNVIRMEKAVGNIGEYYPFAYASDKEYYENKNSIDIISGEGTITVTNNSVEKFEFRVSDSNNLIIELPRLYYKGYILTNNEENVEIYNNSYGFIELNARDGDYKLKYVGTFLYNFFKVVRIIFVIFIIIISIYKKKIKNLIIA